MGSRALLTGPGQREANPVILRKVGSTLAGVAFATAVAFLLIPRSVSFDEGGPPQELSCGTVVAPESWPPTNDLFGSFAREYCPDALEQMRAGSATAAAAGVCLAAVLAMWSSRRRRSAVVLAAAAVLSPVVLRIPVLIGGDDAWSSFEVSAAWSWLLVGSLVFAAICAHLGRTTRPRTDPLQLGTRSAALVFSMTALASAIVLNHLADPRVFFGDGPQPSIYLGPWVFSDAPLFLAVVAALAGIRDYRHTRHDPAD